MVIVRVVAGAFVITSVPVLMLVGVIMVVGVGARVVVREPRRMSVLMSVLDDAVAVRVSVRARHRLECSQWWAETRLRPADRGQPDRREPAPTDSPRRKGAPWGTKGSRRSAGRAAPRGRVFFVPPPARGTPKGASGEVASKPPEAEPGRGSGKRQPTR